MAIQIDCIEKADRDDPTTAIQWIGGRNADGSRWKITQKDAISGIKSGKWSFYVSKNGRAVNVGQDTAKVTWRSLDADIRVVLRKQDKAKEMAEGTGKTLMRKP